MKKSRTSLRIGRWTDVAGLLVAVALAVTVTDAMAQQTPPPPRPAVQTPPASTPISPAPPPPVAVQAATTRYVVEIAPTPGPAWWTTLIPILGPIVSGLIAFEGVRRGLRYTDRNTARTLEVAYQTSLAANSQKANEAELREIRDKVEGFYGPYMQVSELNLLLSKDLKSRQGDAETFRLLVALFDQKWRVGLSPGDWELVQQIRDNGARLENMIIEKAGCVDSAILPYLARASAHFRILRLAHDKKLGTDPSPFERYVYPRVLDEVLVKELARLNARETLLRGAPTKAATPMAPPSGLPKLDAWIAGPTSATTLGPGAGVVAHPHGEGRASAEHS